jgi:hypothetical protein
MRSRWWWTTIRLLSVAWLAQQRPPPAEMAGGSASDGLLWWGKTRLLRHFILKPIISPRQARDNYRENSKDEFLQDEIEKFFGGWATPVSATDGAGTPGSATDGGGGGSGDSSRVAALSFDDEFDPRAAVRKTRPAPFSFSNFLSWCLPQSFWAIYI